MNWWDVKQEVWPDLGGLYNFSLQNLPAGNAWKCAKKSKIVRK